MTKLLCFDRVFMRCVDLGFMIEGLLALRPIRERINGWAFLRELGRLALPNDPRDLFCVLLRAE
jgi:ornithine cyclodeaminase